MKKIIALGLAAALAISGSAAPKKKPAPKAPRTAATATVGLPVDQRVDSLLKLMTLDEKIGQLIQYTGVGYTPDRASQIAAGQVGSLLNEVDPVVVNKLQKEAVENSRLGIPLVIARDVIHGFKTVFPLPIGQAASWNPEIVRNGSRVSADEASSTGVRWTFSPMVDIARDARWGRIAEGYGEDPYLAGVMGVAAVEGYQTDDLTRPNTLAACVKHFAGYGFAEGGRDYNTTWIPEGLLRDVVLPPFKAGADAGAATFMCSFNDIDGVPSSGNKYLLNDILRGEWGWDGLLVSDWGSIDQMLNHGYSKDHRQATQQAVEAGVDMDMENNCYNSELKKLVEDGVISESRIDQLVKNVLRLKFRLGLFENPYVDIKTANRFYTPENLAAAQKAAEESAILLKNNGILPLASGKKILVTGPMADARHDQNGTWCFDMEKDRTVTPLQSLRELYGAENIIYEPGLTYSRDKNADGIAKATAAANDADVILFFGGEEAMLSGEAHSRADISLPGAQKEMMAALKATGKPVVMVLMAGRPMTIENEVNLSDATLFNFHPGTMGGPAIANILSGKVNPSGKLPVSFSKMVGQEPYYYNRKATGRPHNTENEVLIDDIELEAGQTSTGCDSYWLDAGDQPAFPFGYGLSYTTFSYGVPTLSATEINRDGTLTVSCPVTNTGSREGAEVVQLYVRDLIGSRARPIRELKGFEKVTLAPGETRTVTFTLPAEALAFYTLNNRTEVEPGDFQLWVAPDAISGTPVTFKVTE
ncbi:MAG: beta-glucosidase BglX [Muribaculaceae bacterium]